MSVGQSFYSNEDVKGVMSLGRLLGEIIGLRNRCSELAKHNKGLIKLVEEQTKIWEVANNISRRHQMLKKLVEILEEQPKINKKILKILQDVMNCTHITLFLNNNGLIAPLISSGTEENYLRVIKLIEYCYYIKPDIINIRDLSTESLANNEIKSQLNSCLILPINPKDGSKAVLCFMRESKEFSRIDKKLGKKICKELSNYENFVQNTKANSKIPYIEYKYLRKYSIPERIDFDFYEFFYEIKIKVGNFFNLSSCSIYIADQMKNQLWTRNSNSSSSLIFPHNSETLIGRTYEYGEIISLPNQKYFMLSDLKVYEGKFVLSLPVCSRNFKDPVIGVIVCTRKDENFNDFETWLLEKYSESFAQILEHIFIINLFLCDLSKIPPANTNFLKSPNSLFRELNKEKSCLFNSLKFEPSQENFSLKLCLGLNNICQSKSNTLQKVLNEADFHKDNTIFFEKLNELVGCKKSAYYTICDFNTNLENVITRQKIVPTELFKLCLEKKSQVYVNKGTMVMPKDQVLSEKVSGVDYLNQKTQDSVIILPVYNRFYSIVGLLQFVNFEAEPDLKFLESLSLFAWVLCLDIESEHWKDIIEETRGQYSLQQWSSLLIQYANSSITKMLSCKNAVYKLVNLKDIKDITKICLDVICIAMDCTHAEIILKSEDTLCIINKTEYFFDSNLDSINNFFKVLDKTGIDHKQIVKEEKNGTFLVIIPVIYMNSNGYLKIENLNQKKYTDYRIDKDETLLELGRKIAEATYGFPLTVENSLDSLIQTIKMMAMQYKPLALNQIIKNAGKSLVDGESTILFTYKDKKLVAEDQKNEYEIPKNYSLSEDQGIASHVFKNRKGEIISDVYKDERFDPIVDKLTGYKTESMICIPLVTNFDQFGVLEVLNKRNGDFREKDLKLLEKFGELVCMVLEIMSTMQITLEERFRLLAISNTMENYILVFNEHKKLVYINKPIDNIFGTTQENVMNLTYFALMHGNKVLMEDLQSVFNDSSVNIKKTYQKFKTRGNSYIKGTDSKNAKIINYRISQLQNFSSECFSGVILIIEDATGLELLHSQFKEVQKNIESVSASIGSESKLQKCIRELTVIKSNADNPEMKDSLSEVIKRLKGGGLKKPKLKIQSHEYNMDAITSILDLSPQVNLPRIPSLYDHEIVTDTSLTVPLEVLRNWDLNAFEVQNQFDYIYSMINDFELIQKFYIDNQVLYNFISKIREKTNRWNNPFHNFTHCFNVMHGVYMLLSSTSAGGYFKDFEILALLVAALCHDADHRGKGNVFEVHSRSSIATTYHDKSVLEQHHAAVAFFTLQEEKCNIFESIGREKFNLMRKLIIYSILGTDMSKHLSMLESMTSRFKDINEKPIGNLEKDIEKLSQLIMHSGDLFHPCKSFKVYKVWSALVCEEFNNQYNEEVKLGLPITEFMKDLDKPRVYYNNEIGFLNFVVKPLWECMGMILSPYTNMLIDKLNDNIETMKKKLEAVKKAEDR